MSTSATILVRNHARQSAIGADIEGMKMALEGIGIPVRVFAREGGDESIVDHPRYTRSARVLSVLHHSIAWPEGLLAYLSARGPKVLRFHNVTPPGYFLRHSLPLVAGTAIGRMEIRLEALARQSDLILSCSDFSTRDLRSLGVRPDTVSTLPPWERPATHVAPDESTMRRLGDGKINLIFVGRISPHKGQHHLVDAVATWVRWWPSLPVRLLLVGGCEPYLSSYGRSVERQVQQLGLADHVELMGAVSQEVLEACYARATVFLLASHHEGFCVPVVEAFRRGVPVVAVSRTAVPETAGDAAVLLPDFDPRAMARAAHDLALDPARRASLVAAGKQRVAQAYDPSDWANRLLTLLGPLIR